MSVHVSRGVYRHQQSGEHYTVLAVGIDKTSTRQEGVVITYVKGYQRSKEDLLGPIKLFHRDQTDFMSHFEAEPATVGKDS